MGAPTTTARRRSTEARDGRRRNEDRPRLKVIDHKTLRAQANRRTMYLAAGLVFVLGLFAVAFAQAELVKGQHELDQMRAQLEDLEDQRTTLERDVDQASAPGQIVNRARALGMVRAADPVYFTAIHSVGDSGAGASGAGDSAQVDAATTGSGGETTVEAGP